MTTETANDAYLKAHLATQDLIQQISVLLFDLPAPDDDKHPIHWGHVGSINEVNNRLTAVVNFLNGSEV